MKTNGNNQKISDYYLGLDVGTNSVGWAVTDKDYSLLRFKGNSMWGSRLFDEAKDASERRSSRTARRLNKRKKQRLELLELLFNDEISKIDPAFFTRLHESRLYSDDKTEGVGKYALFNENGLTDSSFFKRFPTMYHLRRELIESDAPHDIRFVYLALHHIIKSRGHFLFELDAEDNYKKPNEFLDELNNCLYTQYSSEIVFNDYKRFTDVLLDSSLNITNKKKNLKECILLNKDDDSLVNIASVIDAIAGATVKLSDLFCDEELKEVEKKSVCLRNDLNESYDLLAEILGDRLDLIVEMKKVFDSARLSQLLGDFEYISQSKVFQYEQNKKDLALLKKYVKLFAPEKKKKIFAEKKGKLNNFAAYGNRTVESGDYTCNREDLCKFLKAELPGMKNEPGYEQLHKKIEDNVFFPKLKGADNSVIPNQLHLKELKKILENACTYLPFLDVKDTDGLTVKEKIISLFDFRIPYYVGPLNKKSKTGWVIRTEEKIYPWNFEKVVNTEESAKAFMIKLIGKCTYTGEPALPKDSLLYSKYMVLNEINPISINGNPVDPLVKQNIYNKLFLQNKKVTRKDIENYLKSNGRFNENDVLSGIDVNIKSQLKSYHDFKDILGKTGDEKMVEDIIQHILVFGDDKKLLKKWLRNNYDCLDDNDIKYISRLKYKDWGRLSREFLTEIYHVDENGEAFNIIDMLYSQNLNLMKLLSDKYSFLEKAEEYRKEKFGTAEGIQKQIKDMYVAPSIKRSIYQALRIVDEIVDIRKSAPKKIFIEVARGGNEDLKGKRTVSRKDRLIELYKSCERDSGELFDALEATEESKLRHDALYLYYTQFGKCMYSGEPIDIERIDTDYDVDHIFPQSKIKDDSLDNRVLVRRGLNIEKGDSYPIKNEIRSKMRSFWFELKQKGLISDKKYERLVRNSELTADELQSFVARQIVETRQSTKALATILKSLYKNTVIVYSKAGNVSDFRHQYDMLKCREINDLHHAKDAYLNIVVGNVYDTKFTQSFFSNITHENYSLNRVFEYDVKGAWEKDKTIETVRKMMSKNNAIVTSMPYEMKGQLFDAQIMTKGKGQFEIKHGLDIQKYGGYNKVAGAYFFAVEHKDKNKTVRTVEPVYILAKKLYETDPIGYCTDILGLTEPKIIYKKILFGSVLNFDGKQFNITGRSNNRLVGKHTYQLSLNYKTEKYIKNVLKYANLCKPNIQKLEKLQSDKNSDKQEIDNVINLLCSVPKLSKIDKSGRVIEKIDSVTAEQNISLYELFMNKLKTPVYSVYFSNVLKCCEDNKDRFKALPIYYQSILLTEILKSFSCDRQTSDLTLIGGAASSGNILLMKNITKCNSAFMINQSVTGLYEYKADLLK